MITAQTNKFNYKCAVVVYVSRVKYRLIISAKLNYI